MPSSDSGEIRRSIKPQSRPAAPAPEQENLPKIHFLLQHNNNIRVTEPQTSRRNCPTLFVFNPTFTYTVNTPSTFLLCTPINKSQPGSTHPTAGIPTTTIRPYDPLSASRNTHLPSTYSTRSTIHTFIYLATTIQLVPEPTSSTATALTSVYYLSSRHETSPFTVATTTSFANFCSSQPTSFCPTATHL